MKLYIVWFGDEYDASVYGYWQKEENAEAQRDELNRTQAMPEYVEAWIQEIETDD